MKVIRVQADQAKNNSMEISPLDQPSAVAIGNFDGVHLGHRHIISKLKAIATHEGLVSVVVSFEPYPREFFVEYRKQNSTECLEDITNQPKSNDNSGFRIMTEAEKITALEKLSIDYFIIIHFDYALSTMSADNFIDYFLINQLKTKQLLVGKDFCFGYNRRGNINLLEELAPQKQYKLNVIEDVTNTDIRVSSSIIRNLLRNKNIVGANQLLVSPYNIMGEVVHGDKRGREIGFATANIEVPVNKLLVTGVFAVMVTVVNSAINPFKIKGVCNVGFRPTYHSDIALLEVHLFDWAGDLYGKTLLVEFIDIIRDEQKFASFDILKAQIKTDAEKARSLLSAI